MTEIYNPGKEPWDTTVVKLAAAGEQRFRDKARREMDPYAASRYGSGLSEVLRHETEKVYSRLEYGFRTRFMNRVSRRTLKSTFSEIGAAVAGRPLELSSPVLFPTQPVATDAGEYAVGWRLTALRPQNVTTVSPRRLAIDEVAFSSAQDWHVVTRQTMVTLRQSDAGDSWADIERILPQGGPHGAGDPSTGEDMLFPIGILRAAYELSDAELRHS